MLRHLAIRAFAVVALCLAFHSPASAALAFNWANWSDNANNNTVTTFNVGATNAQGANGTFTSGDLLIGCVIVSTTANVTDPGSQSWPAGWTRLWDDWNTEPGTVFGDINFHYSCAWKIAGGSETGSYAVSWINTARGASWVLFDYGNANGATPIDASGNHDATTASTTSMQAPSISPAGSTDILLIVGFYASTLTSYTLPGGFTQRANVATSSSSRPEIIGGDHNLVASGTTGTQTITTGASGVPSAIAIAIAPGAAGATAHNLTLMGVGQ